jgi:hypothetical protein
MRINVSWTTQRAYPPELSSAESTIHHNGFIAQFLDGTHAMVVEEKVGPSGKVAGCDTGGRTEYSFHVVRTMDLSIYGVEHGR